MVVVNVSSSVVEVECVQWRFGEDCGEVVTSSCEVAAVAMTCSGHSEVRQYIKWSTNGNKKRKIRRG